MNATVPKAWMVLSSICVGGVLVLALIGAISWIAALVGIGVNVASAAANASLLRT